MSHSFDDDGESSTPTLDLSNLNINYEFVANQQRVENPQNQKKLPKISKQFLENFIAVNSLDKNDISFQNLLKQVDSLNQSQLFPLLLSLSTNTENLYVQLFALVSLKEWGYNLEELQSLKADPKLCKLREKSRRFWMRSSMYEKLSADHNSTLLLNYQINTVLHSLEQLLEPTNEVPVDTQPRIVLYSPSLLLSPDNNSVRCHEFNYTFYSSCHTDAPSVYFYEVLLFTTSNMKIGWTTRKSRNEAFNRGNEVSICFDGFSQEIYLKLKKYKANNVPKWQLGDVVGCLLNVPAKQFSFFLNGTQIQLSLLNSGCSTDFSSPFYATVSLLAHQQIFINFGQALFKYPPTQFDYLDFHTIVSKKTVSEITDMEDVITETQLTQMKNSDLIEMLAEFMSHPMYPQIRMRLSDMSRFSLEERETFFSKLDKMSKNIMKYDKSAKENPSLPKQITALNTTKKTLLLESIINISESSDPEFTTTYENDLKIHTLGVNDDDSY